MKKSIRKKIIKMILLFVTAVIFICFSVSAVCIAVSCNRHEKEALSACIDFAEMTIDPDKARDFITSRQTDEDYYTTLKKLDRYAERNKSTISRISVISYSNTMGNYIYDTNGAELGTKADYTNYTQSVKAELINGRNSWNKRENGVLYAYSPLRTVDDRLAGYIVCSANTKMQTKYIFPAVFTFIALAVASVFPSVLFVLYIKKKIFLPIQQLTDVSLSLSGTSTDTKSDISLFDYECDDEIGLLGNAVKQMFLDINSSSENLSKALFDANHDGMTQALNKRCYETMEKMFTECHSICVIYFDVNNLKLMNDTLGHEKGDYVIKRASSYIKKMLTPKDYFFRMGGDEFLMVMTECSLREIEMVIEKIESDSPYILNRDSDPVKCALSYGYAYAKGNYYYGKLLSEAEENMYKKKAELKKLMNMPDR